MRLQLGTLARYYPVMRVLLTLLLGLVIGAAGFHAYYRSLAAPERCGWDHPFDAHARDACRRLATAAGYGAAVRAQMDKLIDDVSR